jgi:hypothetical protein
VSTQASWIAEKLAEQSQPTELPRPAYPEGERPMVVASPVHFILPPRR